MNQLRLSMSKLNEIVYFDTIYYLVKFNILKTMKEMVSFWRQRQIPFRFVIAKIATTNALSLLITEMYHAKSLIRY